MSTYSTITLDGAGGGGQVLRTALSLATITGTAFRIENIRGGRPDPGLKPQHLTAVELVAELCDADVDGAELGADSLTFQPGDARRSSLQAAVGTAGSLTLLFDTVLPIAATYDEPFELTATGGTNVKWAPTIEYQQLVKGPLLTNLGVDATIEVSKTGFYPAGGGEAIFRTTPGSLSPIELESAGFPTAVERVQYVSTASTGSSLLLRGVYERSVVGFDALGELGRTSEAVAEGAVQQFTAFHDTDGAVDVFMADQLMPFLALAGGRVRIPAVSAHVETNLNIISAFGSDLRLDRQDDGTAVLEASSLLDDQ